MKNKTDQETDLAGVRRLCYGDDNQGKESINELDKEIDDPPFERIYDAAMALKQAGRTVDHDTIRQFLRERGCNYYSQSDFDHAISAVHTGC